ncbi:hypothetical protein PV772_19625, partial [Pseudarthrobacter sp. CC12]
MSPHEPGHGNPPEERGKDRGDGDGGPTGTGAGIPGRTARDQPWAAPAGQPGNPQQPGWPAPAWNGPGTWQQPTQPQQWPQNAPYPSGETSRPGGTYPGAPYAGQPYNGAPYAGQPYNGAPYAGQP